MPDHSTNILIVEDDPLHADMLLGLIGSEKSEFNCQVVASLEAAIHSLDSDDYELVILDLALTDSDGIESLIRLQTGRPKLPIIILTASKDENLAMKALQLGAQDYLIKWEVDQRLLQRSIRYALDRNRFVIERQNQETSIRKITEMLPEILALIDVKTFEFSFINDQAEKILGYPTVGLKRSTLSEFIHPDDLEKVIDSFRDCVDQADENARELEFRVKNLDGEWNWLDSRIIVYNRHTDGSPQNLLFVAHDATNRKRAEIELTKSEARYSDLIENSGLLVGTHDINGRILSINKKALEYAGVDNTDELIGLNIKDFILPYLLPQFKDYLHEVLLTRTFEGLCAFHSIKGDKVVLDITNSLGTDINGDLIIRCIGRDVTEQLKTERALRESEERLRLSLQAAHFGIWEWQIEKGIYIQDDTAREVLGDQTGSLKHFLKIVHPEDSERLKSKVELALNSGLNYSLDFRLFDSKGNIKWVEAHARVVSNHEQTLTKLIGVVRDITEIKLLEMERYRTSRLESIGSLVSGISHDLNNIFTPILMGISTLKKSSLDENAERWIPVIQKSAERGRDLIEQMLTFGKGYEVDRETININSLVKDLLIIIGETLPKDIEVELHLEQNLWDIVGNQTQIHQVLLNLCINSKDAMPKGGKLTISTENLLIDEDNSKILNTAAKPGRYVGITITDTGLGIPPNIIEHIFDPYFTTKKNSQGTGLGLSTSRTIVITHGGFITVSSQVGRGTKFIAHLPVLESNKVKPGVSFNKNAEKGHDELILMIDDERDICDVAKHCLESNGYRVIIMQNGIEAIKIYEERRDEIQVVITDLMMPEVDGPGIIRKLRQINPGVKIVAISGIRGNEKYKEAARAGFNVFLQKPFTEEKLLSTLSYLFNPDEDDVSSGHTDGSFIRVERRD
ncbi:MAG: response regulator [Acidobacteria bacterium]|nr:response regulator [Acidobacteriota bacterium]